MNIWGIILLGALGTYLMRSAGVWIAPEMTKARWLGRVPFAVILVMAVSSIAGAGGTTREAIAALSATAIVIATSIGRLSLILRIAIACLVYGLLMS